MADVTSEGVWEYGSFIQAANLFPAQPRARVWAMATLAGFTFNFVILGKTTLYIRTFNCESSASGCFVVVYYITVLFLLLFCVLRFYNF